MNRKLILPGPEGDNILPFQPVIKPGGKDPNNNWLKDLTEGTTFVCRRKKMGGQLQIYLDVWTLINNRTKTYVLSTEVDGDGPSVYRRVDPVDFCEIHELVEVLEEGQK